MTKKQLTAQCLTIVAADGEPRMVLTTDAESGMPVIHFLDGRHGDRLIIGLGPDGNPGFTLLRDHGFPGVGIGLGESGCGVTVTYPNGAPAIRIGVNGSGMADIEVYDSHGQRTWPLP